MDNKISLKELLLIIKESKKMIGVIVIASAIFVGGFRVYSDYREQHKATTATTTTNSGSYEKELEEYNKDSKLLTDTLNIINAEKKSLIAMIGENPIMKIDAFSSESVRIKIVATDKARYNTVENVLLSANSDNLFGKSTSVLERYKWDIVQIPDMGSTNDSGNNEVASTGTFIGNVYVYTVKGYKAKDVANNIVRFLETERNGRLQGVDFSITVVKSGEAAKQSLYNKQKMYRTNLENLKLESDKVNETMRSLQIPSQNTSSSTNYVKRSIKSGFVGGVFGALVAIIFATYKFLRKQKKDFSCDIETRYGIPALGTIASAANADILVADIEQLMLNNKGVAFVAVNSDKNFANSLKEIMCKLETKADYIGCIVDDINAIIRISSFDNFILVVSDEGIDISENARKTISKLERLDKKILGCVNIG
ncbi:hypothetical protein [Mogibacterium timidum]|uniref:hypothetical protein n=1 Tax=Mogibacterium timidum TaxID=35519 RepID=UPI00248D0340|nr:hypothetical protein [Mogibacterium timidum]